MECFSGFWSRRLCEGENTPSWILVCEGKTQFPISEVFHKLDLSRENSDYFQEIIGSIGIMEAEDLRKVLEEKARRHHTYYETLVGIDEIKRATLTSEQKMAKAVRETNRNYANAGHSSAKTEDNHEAGSQGSLERKHRQRRRGVYEITGTLDDFSTRFQSVQQLRENYMAMLEKTYKHLSVNDKPTESAKKEKSELLVPPSSGYCSSSASGASDDEREKEKSWSEKKLPVRRCASSDSAVHSDEEGPIVSNWGEKKEEDSRHEVFRRSPYSPRASIDHSNVPSRMIIPAQYVPLPINRKFSVDCVSDVHSDIVSDSRRESCFSEGDEQPRYRYWRTPSVVVSDYSDDILGITLEDIEYIRSKRNSISPDSSLHSSCSNLNYCGSSISGLEGDYVLSKPYRKSSNCSSCSTLSDDEEAVQEPNLQPRKTKEVVLIMGISGALRQDELVKMAIEDIQEENAVLIETVPDTKTDKKRVFTVTNIDFIKIYRKYAALRPKHIVNNRRIFLRYGNGKCTAQVVGVRTIGKMPSIIAKYLRLPNPETYTGHCFRRSSATLLANTGADMSILKRHGGWKSTTVAEGYVEDSIENKKQISNSISGDIVSGLNIGNNHYSETLDVVASTSGVNISNNTNCTINVNIHPK